MSLLLHSLVACSGGTAEVAVSDGKSASAVSPALLASTWQVRMAVDAARAPFEGRDGWVAWFQGKRAQAIASFAGESDPGALARTHAEYAAIYRQAALLSANATVQVYGADVQPTDPVEVSYLLGVSGALLADPAMRGKLGAAAASTVPGLAAQDAAWKVWSEGGAWPPDAPAATSPGAPGDPSPGQTPGAGPVPTYRLPEQNADTVVDANDPGAMWALARFHEAAAKAASPADSGAIDALIDPWRLPAEARTAPAAPVTLSDTFLFMSTSSTAGDVLFLSDLERDGVAAIAAHQSDSPFAVAIAACTTDGHLAVDCILDQSAALGTAIEGGMASVAGKEDSFHRPFAEFARVGLLRAADRAAWKMDDREAGGRLRINALDRTTNGVRDPLFLLSVAAWDAGNRNSVRAEELVHGLLTEVPGLEAARLPLDALHIRLSRNAAPGRPMH